MADTELPVGGNELRGVNGYIGIPEAGKTTLAVVHLRAAIERTGYPSLIIDSQGADNFTHLPHAKSVEECIDLIWGDEEHAVYIPENIDEVNTLARACRAGKRVHVLIDEARYWLSKNSISTDLSSLIRSWRHSRTTVQFVTQYFNDLNSEVQSCAPTLWVFRCTAEPVLDTLERYYSADRDAIKSLPQGRFIKVYQGFSDADRIQPTSTSGAPPPPPTTPSDNPPEPNP